MSLTPTIIVPLKKPKDKGKYRVRTLLDSGSMTNWITKKVLNQISYTKIGSAILEVHTLTSVSKKRYQLVEVYYTYQGEDFNIKCYVHDDFTEHVTVKGIVEHIKEQTDLDEKLVDLIVDPASEEIDHINMSKGVGLILCTASVNKLKKHRTTHIPDQGLILEDTIFGIAVSGAVPPVLRDSVNTICALNIVPRIVQKEQEPLFEINSEEQEILRENLSFLSNLRRLRNGRIRSRSD